MFISVENVIKKDINNMEEKIEEFLNKHAIMISHFESYLNQNAFAPVDMNEMIRKDLSGIIQEAKKERDEQIVSIIKEPLENAFYECNLEPEEAEREASSIINYIK